MVECHRGCVTAHYELLSDLRLCDKTPRPLTMGSWCCDECLLNIMSKSFNALHLSQQ